MAILAAWVSMSGLRRTAAGFVHDLSVKCDAHAGVDRVEFAIVANGTPHSTLTASAPSMRFPNFSAQALKPFWGHGVSLDLSTVPAGTIVVTATVFDAAAGSYELPATITIYNDTDGADRRPRQVTVYVDGADGNDANTGASWAQAVKTIGQARTNARSGAGDLSGAQIICRGTFTDVAGGDFPEVSTSGAWWCDIIADAAGAYLNLPTTNSQRYVSSGVGGTGSTTVICRNRWVGFRFGNSGIISYSWGGIAWHWFDGCFAEALNWEANRLSVLYADPAIGISGDFVGWDGAVPGRRHYSKCSLRGAVLGYEVHQFLYDCEVLDFIGIGAKYGSAATQCVTGNLLMQSERYRVRDVHGFVRMDADATMGQGRPALEITKPTSDIARVTGPVGGYAFNLDADDLVDATYWGLRFEGSGARNLDTGVGLLVTAVGNTGGAPWVEVFCPGATAGSIAANTCSFYTARVATGMNYWNIHPDGIQFERALSRDVVFDCAIVDAPNLQSYYTSGGLDIDLCLFDNLRDDGSGDNACPWTGSDVTNSILQRLTLCGQFQNSASASGWAGTYVRNCVFGSLGGEASSIPSRGGTVTHCHVIAGSAFGTSGTNGAWFAGDPSTAPWSFEPSATGDGSTAVIDPPEWRYSASGSTRGVMRNVGELDWSVPEEGLTATGSANVAVSASGTASLTVAANGAAGVGANAAGAANLSVAANGAAGVGISATGSAGLQIAAAGQSGVGVSATGTATIGSVPIVASGQVGVGVSATGTAVLSMAPSVPAPQVQQVPQWAQRPRGARARRRGRFRWAPPWG